MTRERLFFLIPILLIVFLAGILWADTRDRIAYAKEYISTVALYPDDVRFGTVFVVGDNVCGWVSMRRTNGERDQYRRFVVITPFPAYMDEDFRADFDPVWDEFCTLF